MPIRRAPKAIHGHPRQARPHSTLLCADRRSTINRISGDSFLIVRLDNDPSNCQYIPGVMDLFGHHVLYRDLQGNCSLSVKLEFKCLVPANVFTTDFSWQLYNLCRVQQVYRAQVLGYGFSRQGTDIEVLFIRGRFLLFPVGATDRFRG